MSRQGRDGDEGERGWREKEEKAKERRNALIPTRRKRRAPRLRLPPAFILEEVAQDGGVEPGLGGVEEAEGVPAVLGYY